MEVFIGDFAWEERIELHFWLGECQAVLGWRDQFLFLCICYFSCASPAQTILWVLFLIFLSVLNLPLCSIAQCSFSCAGLAHTWGKRRRVKRLRVAWKQVCGEQVANSFIAGTCIHFRSFLSNYNVPQGIWPPGSYTGSLGNIESVCGNCVLS